MHLRAVRHFKSKNHSMLNLVSLKQITLPILMAILILFSNHGNTSAQDADYWQQEVEYTMEIDMDVDLNQFDGKQSLVYHNNSPDTLDRVFYHLFFNAFQPNSMMDKRSRIISDPDRRIGDKIYYYDETEIGYQKIKWMKQDGAEIDYTVKGTIMEVHLSEPIAPGESVTFEMEFEAQVPLQTRRSGRDNAEGIRFSMSQWYPKIAAYDPMGWHANPYVEREFYAPFGTFDVKIHIDRNYIVAAGSILQNPEEVGYGYETPGMEVNRPDGDKLMWHFRSENVHDMMWAADPDYNHMTAQVPDGPLLRFFHQTEPLAENAVAENNDSLIGNWSSLPEYAVRGFEYMSDHYGKYPYDEYIFIQGGDGGMEYGMGTLITGNRSLRSLVGVAVHELVHAWYEGAIGNNEIYDQWIDEGFTSYASEFIMKELFNESAADPMLSRYQRYYRLVNAGTEESMHIHADHYVSNNAHDMATYTKGAIFLHQLGYVIGDDVLQRTLKSFFDQWKFKHPYGIDFIRIAEKESGIELKWYYEYWVTTTKTIDYGITEVAESDQGVVVNLERFELMPMPLDIEVEFLDGSVSQYYIPMRIMWGQKENEFPDVERVVQNDWPWVFPEYSFTIDRQLDEIIRIEIDPTQRMADINRENNEWVQKQNEENLEESIEETL